MAAVTVRNIRKSFGDLEVIHGIDLNIEDGSFVVLLGPSGCGKSTLLRMIAGLEPISAGEISIGGRVVNDLHPKDRDIAMVFQNYALYAHMSVFDNMAFSMQLKKMPQAEIKKRVDWAASILDLTPYLGRFPRQLSGGQRQRVAMGRAIVRDPAVFLFDEPLSNLDAKLRVQMRTEIKALHQRLSTTTVYVTHDQIEAMTMADVIVILKDGRIEQIGGAACGLRQSGQPVRGGVHRLARHQPDARRSGGGEWRAGGAQRQHRLAAVAESGGQPRAEGGLWHPAGAPEAIGQQQRPRRQGDRGRADRRRDPHLRGPGGQGGLRGDAGPPAARSRRRSSPDAAAGSRSSVRPGNRQGAGGLIAFQGKRHG